MLSKGSEWRRWEPHIHAPSTVMNNQFGGLTAWGDYLTALERATPVIEAIAVTDYYVTDTYKGSPSKSVELHLHPRQWRSS